MKFGTAGRMRSRARVLTQATALSITALAALMLVGTAAAPSSALAQVKAPAKVKLKPALSTTPKADPTDGVADQLNAKWQQDNGAFSGFTTAKPAVTPASYAVPPTTNDWGDRLVTRAMKYLGTPYRHGGISPSTGFDCSGFVYYLYGAEFSRTIPRMPDGMAREGVTIGRNDLKRGDIVFFGNGSAFTHVGIYAGNGQFVHATHRGSPVSVTALDSDYYRQHYMTAVRLSPR